MVENPSDPYAQQARKRDSKPSLPKPNPFKYPEERLRSRSLAFSIAHRALMVGSF